MSLNETYVEAVKKSFQTKQLRIQQMTMIDRKETTYAGKAVHLQQKW